MVAGKDNKTPAEIAAAPENAPNQLTQEIGEEGKEGAAMADKDGGKVKSKKSKKDD